MSHNAPINAHDKAQSREGVVTSEPDVDVTECPECGRKGTYDGRVLIGGRGIYRCACGEMWQDAREKPTSKGWPLNG